MRFRIANQQLTEAEKQNSEWQQNLLRFLSVLADWSGRGEATREDYFHQKRVLFNGLIEIVPRGAARNEMIRGYVRLVVEPEMQQENCTEWFLQANDLINLAHSSRGAEKTIILDILNNCGNATLRLYADLITILPQTA